MTVYTIDNILTIKNKNILELDVNIKQIIDELSITVGSATYSKTPVFSNKNRETKVNKVKKEFNNWEAVRNFKKTEMVTNIGIDKKVDELRCLLNKLTSKNYDVIKPQIVTLVDAIISNNNDTDINKICNFIFEVASSNKFYSDIYALLYSQMIDSYSILKTILDNTLKTYLILFDDIELGDPKLDYDKFCKINANNDKRKAISLFLTNLMKNNIISETIIMDMVCKLQNLLESLMNDENKKKESEEIIENIYILLINSYEIITNKDEIKLYVSNNIETISKKSGISNKANFKYMDIIDFIEKN
tara:strand:+ start:6484 stop:7395 length:912 start_codon:yes stop_codon:yes gene_type:complete